jgi:hypothetical protein
MSPIGLFFLVSSWYVEPFNGVRWRLDPWIPGIKNLRLGTQRLQRARDGSDQTWPGCGSPDRCQIGARLLSWRAELRVHPSHWSLARCSCLVANRAIFTTRSVGRCECEWTVGFGLGGGRWTVVQLGAVGGLGSVESWGRFFFMSCKLGWWFDGSGVGLWGTGERFLLWEQWCFWWDWLGHDSQSWARGFPKVGPSVLQFSIATVFSRSEVVGNVYDISMSDRCSESRRRRRLIQVVT